MTNSTEFNIDDETIQSLKLQLTTEPLNAPIDLVGRVFKYPELEKVYIMESDLYGNMMPQGSCFLAFQGNHGLIGKHLYIETLKNSTSADIQVMIATHDQG
jgi:hypothetical protein